MAVMMADVENRTANDNPTLNRAHIEFSSSAPLNIAALLQRLRQNLNLSNRLLSSFGETDATRGVAEE
jgi:hypothetical protein